MPQNNDLFSNIYKPDVLSCLADLSNDEVFTPPKVANQMLDLLPQELFRDPNTKFLDPACKSGIFLREIAKRLIAGLADKIPNLQERCDWIFKHQLYGIAITELTSLLSRRSLYCSKYPNSLFSITKFDDVEGNILFHKIKHTWRNGKCIFCGTAENGDLNDVSREGMESHAYEWIHTLKPEEIFKMKFDVIISNPPYQMNDGGNGVSAAPVFHHFINRAKKLNPRFLTMIIPARWYAGGKGLDEFRSTMLLDKRISKLVDYESSKDCFDGVNIAGGVCYFLWERDYKGDCQIVNMIGDDRISSTRPLDEYPILIRSNLAISIVDKVMRTGCSVLKDHAYPRNPFGFATNFRGRETKRIDDIQILTSKGFQFIQRNDVQKNKDIIDSYKILIGRLVPSNGELDVKPENGYNVITDTKLIGPGQINTETYLDIGVFKTKLEAKNFDVFLNSKLPRFLLRQAISSLNVTRDCFRFVPFEDYLESWTDEKLYKKYGLSQEEIDFVEKTIKDRDLTEILRRY